MNMLGIFLFIVFIVMPWGLEQVAYSRYVGSPAAVEHRRTAKVVRSYGIAYIWDIAHFLVLIAAGFRFIGSEQPLSTWEWIGYLLFPFGVTIRIWALRELGSYYDAQVSVQPQHAVIASGPYHFMRHPLHFGMTAKVLGLAFLAPSWLGLPAALSVILLTLYADRSEDLVLLKEIGSAYEKYYVQTWDIVDLIIRKRLPVPTAVVHRSNQEK